MKRILGLCLSLLLLACQTEGSKTPSVSGKFNGAGDIMVKLQRLSLNMNATLIAQEETKNGKFTLDLGESFEPGIYLLQMGSPENQKQIVFAMDEGQSAVSFEGDYENFSIYDLSVKGSALTAQSIDASRELTVGRKDPQTQLYIMDTTSNALIALQMAIMKFRTSKIAWPKVRKIKAKLEDQYPNSQYTNDFGSLVAVRDQQLGLTERQPLPGGLKVGDKAPEIDLQSPDGKIIKLSSLRGKVVLIDFWASWCMPCRRANPHVVDIYEKYKNQGFTVYSVSLDRQGQKDRWLKAIEDDNLSWPNHVSDLKFWNSEAAKTYGVSSIPATFLLDRDGNIAALRPRTQNLESEIQKLL